MKLGAFSVSLAVKDLQRSREFYEKLGFEQFAGDAERNYLIMKNGDSVIGLFQGMFEENILTFNPGWDQSAQNLEEYTDVRDIHKKLNEQGVLTVQETLDGDKGPGSFIMVDPDGNPILIDQHV
jgi:catechol 2,3-dioxygenase-like lactoylglutathione lyase family enzyme